MSIDVYQCRNLTKTNIVYSHWKPKVYVQLMLRTVANSNSTNTKY